MPMTDKDLKQRWIEALLSGDYLEGPPGVLYANGDNGTSYCPLGVLCHIQDQNFPIHVRGRAICQLPSRYANGMDHTEMHYISLLYDRGKVGFSGVASYASKRL